MRDKFFSGNNKQDFDNLPNNTFHKLFNNNKNGSHNNSEQ